MWKAVAPKAGRTGSPKPGDDDDDDDLAKVKGFRVVTAGSAYWIRNGYVVACVAWLALFLFSGVLTQIGCSLGASSAPDVLKYVATFNVAESFLDNLSSNYVDSDQPSDENFIGFDVGAAPSSEIMSSTSSTERPVGCNEADAKLKVFMYDLPREFHYGMMSEFRPPDHDQVWPRNASALPRYPGGLYQQHSPEYWLVSDVLTSEMPDRESACTAFRVRRWQDADVVLVPFFASLGYNKYSRAAPLRAKAGLDFNQELQVKLLAYLRAQPAWRAPGGEVRHVVVIHHPNSMAYIRDELRGVMFVVADFGRYGPEIANVRKDVVAPYKHVVKTYINEDDVEMGSRFRARPTLLFFQGAIARKEGGIIRQQLYELLHAEHDVVFATGAATNAGIRTATAGMRKSKFCLHLAGDTPSSNRLFDAVASHCVPLIVSDAIELPFEDVLNYSEFCLFVSATDALRPGFLTDMLREFSPDDWTRMHRRILQVQRHFQFQHPAEPGDAVHMTWDAISRKLPALTLARHKRRRYQSRGLKPQDGD